MKDLTSKECGKWYKNKEINPRTGDNIKYMSSAYKEFASVCRTLVKAKPVKSTYGKGQNIRDFRARLPVKAVRAQTQYDKMTKLELAKYIASATAEKISQLMKLLKAKLIAIYRKLVGSKKKAPLLPVAEKQVYRWY